MPKAAVTDRSLQYLRRAMEEGYKGIEDVYKDSEFAGLRKDPAVYRAHGGPAGGDSGISIEFTNIYTIPRNFLRRPCLETLITPENNRVSKEKR